ncbi:MAG: hypothetical protein N2C14_30535 [Planctomycetales bacterium]
MSRMDSASGRGRFQVRLSTVYLLFLSAAFAMGAWRMHRDWQAPPDAKPTGEQAEPLGLMGRLASIYQGPALHADTVLPAMR